LFVPVLTGKNKVGYTAGNVILIKKVLLPTSDSLGGNAIFILRIIIYSKMMSEENILHTLFVYVICTLYTLNC